MSFDASSTWQTILQMANGFMAALPRLALALVLIVTAAFPSFTPANLISTLGIGGVAIGFAFKDIFQNFLAGILILITRPFTVGDQIRFKDYEGTVEDIQTRATSSRHTTDDVSSSPTASSTPIPSQSSPPSPSGDGSTVSVAGTTWRRREASSCKCSGKPRTSRPIHRPT
ncbi:MAG: mechanosensitive ion channel domain-containing protein [Gemmatimonadaceae bacterium]